MVDEVFYLEVHVRQKKLNIGSDSFLGSFVKMKKTLGDSDFLTIFQKQI